MARWLGYVVTDLLLPLFLARHKLKVALCAHTGSNVFKSTQRIHSTVMQISNDNWTYSRNFLPNASIFNFAEQELVFEGPLTLRAPAARVAFSTQ